VGGGAAKMIAAKMVFSRIFGRRRQRTN